MKIINYIKYKLKKAKVYKFQYLGTNTHIDETCQFNHTDKIGIGSDISIQRDCTFSGHGGIYIGDGTIIAHCVDVFSGEHNYDSEDLKSIPFDDRFILGEVNIGKNVWIGAHCIILPGVTIGEGAIIGAGAIVTHDIPSMAIAAGNPAKIIRYRNIDKYNELAEKDFVYMKIKYDKN